MPFLLKTPAARAAMALGLITLATFAAIAALGPAAYPWVKAVHVMAIIAWMAGMLYLPRLFVYHAGQAPGFEPSALLKVMEGRLLRIIMNPAMVLAWVLGLWLAWAGGYLMAPWFHMKLALVLIMTGFHGFLAGATRRFCLDQNTHSARFWRILNEVPAVLMAGIVILVIVKPI